MLPRVRRLPETLVNQIAAGEVVERPASVVKELCENALDAGARQIEIRLEAGGTQALEVTDDGGGMDREDALLALERHATSKLATEADLSAIATLGFRGEALPAIASVSRFTLTTRTRGAAAATRLKVEGGGPLAVEEWGAPEGTRVAVDDLFFNTPARRKFLKRPAAEAAQVTEVVTRLMLARPGVGFALVSSGRRALAVTAATPLRDRVALALGRETFERLVEVDWQDAARGLSVRGFAGAPDLSASTSQKIHLFVNGRLVRDRSLQHAVGRAYANLLPPGRFPVAVLFVTTPLAEVDVNVHPQKTEVRFSEPRAIYDAVGMAVRGALRPAPWLNPAAGKEAGVAEGAGVDTALGPEGEVQVAGASGPHANAAWGFGQAGSAFVFDARAWARSALVGEAAGTWGTSWPGRAATDHGGSNPAAAPAAALPPAGKLLGETGYFASLRYLGQLAHTYLVCESLDHALVVLDQHAAHERVCFEDLRAARRGRPIESQRLLVPVVVDLGPASAAALAVHGDKLAALGFEVEPFGGESFSVAAVPALLGGAKLLPLFIDLAEQLGAVEGADAAIDAESDLLATMACHLAIRAGDALGPGQVAALLASLDRIDFKVRCPHGRPVVTELRLSELEKRVERR